MTSKSAGQALYRNDRLLKPRPSFHPACPRILPPLPCPYALPRRWLHAGTLVSTTTAAAGAGTAGAGTPSPRYRSVPLASLRSCGIPTTTTATAANITTTASKVNPSARFRTFSSTSTSRSAHSPLASASTGSSPTRKRKPTTLRDLAAMHARAEPITMLTAHDFPSAHVADAAGIDVVLVGDSLAMVAMGLDDTSAVTLDEMLHHCRMVARGTSGAFVVGDLPMGSYEVSPEQAVASAIRMVKEGRVNAVKLEGGAEMAPTVARIVAAGIPVLGHVGLTPQRQNMLGGFRVQGKTAADAMRVLHDALAVQAAGAWGMVVEAVPEAVAARITEALRVPTIGIGAGNGTSGQVLVQVDMGGNYPPGRFLPKFVKRYGDMWGEALRAAEQYGREVKERSYPAEEHTYPMSKGALEEFEGLMARAGSASASDSAAASASASASQLATAS